MYQITEKVFSQIKHSLLIPETGGILGVNANYRNTVTHFHYDSTGITEKHSYTPDIETLNSVISEWAGYGIEFIGFVHSHPGRQYRLSSHDIEYAGKIKNSCAMPEILMLIYLTDSKEFYQYVL